jgi:ATP-binding protein involved in chromosome partitioning
MKPVPQEIKALEDRLTIRWSDGHDGRYKSRELRLACRCAACVDEWSHENLIMESSIPVSVKPKAIEIVGNYALHITWSDGHNTGIYTYDYLRGLCSCEACAKERSFEV